MKVSTFLLNLLQLFWVSTVAGDKPASCTVEWVEIVLEGNSTTSHYNAVIADHKKICDTLITLRDKRGFLTDKDRTRSCGCACHHVVEKKFCKLGDGFAGFDDAAKTLMDWAGKDEEILIEEDVIDVWKTIMWRLWPLIMAIAPVVLKQADRYDWPVFGSIIIAYTVMFFLVDMTYAQSFYLYLTGFVCLANTNQQGVVVEVIGGSITIVAFILASFISDVFFQIGTAVLIVFVYVAWMVQTFAVRRAGTVPGLLVMLALILVMFEQITIMREGYHLNSFNLDVFEMILNSIVPSGKSRYFSRNAFNLGAQAAHRFCRLIPKAEPRKLRIFLGFSFLQFLMAFCFRAMFGMFVMLTMRFKFSPKNFTIGFWVYMTDVTTGFNYLFSSCFNLEKGSLDQRRFAYSILNVGLIIFEAYFGADILAVRIFMTFLDKFVFMTGYSSLPKYLRADMAYADFPQDGAHPWCAMARIQDLAKYVVEITATDDNSKNYKGLGFLRHSGRKTALMSVSHVMRGFRRIGFRDVILENPMPTIVSAGDDPVAHIVVNSSVKGADVRLLDKFETDMVNSLFFLKMDEFKEPCISWVSKFNFDKEYNVRAAVDLSRGDSGGPVFAVMNDDDIRYAGCVSAGDPSGLSGNWISSVCATKCRTGEALEYDSDSVNSLKGKHVQITSPRDDADLVARVNVLNRKVQSIHDKIAAVWFIDESDDNHEAIWFDKHDDVVAYIEGKDEEQYKKDSEHWHKKKGKRRKTSFKLAQQIVHVGIKELHSQAQAILGERLAGRYIKDFRCGYMPLVTVDGSCVKFTPNVSRDTLLVPVDFY